MDKAIVKFFRAAIKYYYKLGILKEQKFILSYFWGQKSKTMVSVELVLLEALRENVLHASLLASGGGQKSLMFLVL